MIIQKYNQSWKDQKLKIKKTGEGQAIRVDSLKERMKKFNEDIYIKDMPGWKFDLFLISCICGCIGYLIYLVYTIGE